MNKEKEITSKISEKINEISNRIKEISLNDILSDPIIFISFSKEMTDRNKEIDILYNDFELERIKSKIKKINQHD